MEQRYKGPIAFEYNHINNNKERTWLKRRIETPYKATLNHDQKGIYLILAHVEGFEKYLHKTLLVQNDFLLKAWIH